MTLSFVQARHSAPSAPIYITVDPDSPAYIVYHDHSYFIRHESSNPSVDNPQRRQTSISVSNSQAPSQSKPSVAVLNQLFLEHQQKAKSSQSDTSTSTSTLDFAAILRALLVKQGHHVPSPAAS
jgi:hypothetical protein